MASKNLDKWLVETPRQERIDLDMVDATFRERFLKAFTASGMSVAELSRKSGVPYHAIDKLKKRPGASTSAENAAALAATLGMDHPDDDGTKELLNLYDQLSLDERRTIREIAQGYLARRTGQRE